MIQKFNQYNEGLTDKMTPKSLEEMGIESKEFLAYIKELENIGFNIKNIQIYKSFYVFNCIDNTSNKKIKMRYLNSGKWSMDINTPAQIGFGKTEEFQFLDFDELLPIIANVVHPNIDDEILELEKKVHFLQNLKKYK